MKLRQAVLDLGVGMIGGYAGTKVMEQVSMKLYGLESEETRKKEEEVRPGDPFYIAAEKTDRLLGLELSEEHLEKLAMYGFHYGLGIGWGADLHLPAPLDADGAGQGRAALRRGSDRPRRRGNDPLLGFSAPNRDYPLAAHLRGIAAHLAFGLGVAAAAKALYKIIPMSRRSS